MPPRNHPTFACNHKCLSKKINTFFFFTSLSFIWKKKLTYNTLQLKYLQYNTHNKFAYGPFMTINYLKYSAYVGYNLPTQTNTNE